MRNRILLLFILSISSLFVSAKPIESSRFDNYTQENGLSNNMVQCIFQDKEGWMWFGTSQGLNRYDGYSFKTYRSTAEDSINNTMTGTLVRCVYQDSNGNYWVGTENGGLNLFNPKSEKFSLIKLHNNECYSANSICEDNQHKIWVGTEKGIAYITDNKELQICDVRSEKYGSLTNIKAISADNNNNLWIGSSKQGLFKFNTQNQQIENIDLPNNNKLQKDEVQTIYLSKDGTIWIGTYYSGVYYVKKGTNRVEQLADYPYSERKSTVRAIAEDPSGLMWFGTRGGLISYDRDENLYNIFKSDIGNDISLIQNSVLSLFIDTKGDLWAGTRGGISYRNHEKQIFKLIQEGKNDNRYLNDEEIYGFTEDNHGNIWIGTESGGIDILNKNTKQFSYLTHKDGLSTDCIKCFLNNGNEIWVGTYMGGINIVDANTHQVKKVYNHNPMNPNSLISNDVWWIMKDHKGQIWIGTAKGLDRYDNGNFVHYPQLVHDEEVVCVMEDSDHDLWIATFSEVIVYDAKSDNIIRHHERCRIILEDKEHRYWLGTYTKGLALYDKKNGVKGYFKEPDMSNNCIQTITEDGDFLWVSTTNGLTRFEKNTHKCKLYDKADGLQDVQFHYNASYKSADGKIWLGGIHGVNIFDPKTVCDNKFVAPIEFNELRIFNKVIGIGKELKEDISAASRIDLDYTQDMFSIGFCALSFSKSQKNQFMYKMEGFDKEWINAGTNNHATYTNLNPGTYTFMVKGANCDGIWNENIKSIEIYIKPPFYKTWWFMLLVALLISGTIYAFLKGYLHRQKLKSELSLEKTRAEKIKEVEEMKIQFFTNISHELRTPLTLIIGPLQQILKNKGIDSETNDNARMAEKNANQLLQLVNQLLDFRRLESGKETLNYSNGDVVSFIGNEVRSFKHLAENKNITLKFECGEEGIETKLDDDKLRKICNNLLSNAVKYTPEGGLITVSLKALPNYSYKSSTTKNSYQLSVSDNGKGIKKENLEKIFELYSQNSAADSSKGTGIGLALVRNYVNLMNGEINVDSEEGKGSTFTITLPIEEVTADAATISVLGEEGAEIAAPAEKDGVTEENKRILLVAEDNSDLRHFIVNYFKKTYKVIEAEDGVIAKQLATENVPDLIITDLIMPNMTGDVLCKELKEDERTSHIPIIMLTAINAHDTEIEVLKSGANDYITKPFNVEILEQKLQNQINRQESLKKKLKFENLTKPTDVELENPDDRFMHKVMEVIEKNMSDADFDVEQLASGVGVSRMQLYRKMAAITNMTAKEFIRSIRIKRAYQLIEQDKLTISEVAYEVGFKDIAYFRKCFKAQIGKNPSEIK